MCPRRAASSSSAPVPIRRAPGASAAGRSSIAGQVTCSTGNPAASASTTASPNDSSRDGDTNTSIADSSAGIPGVRPSALSPSGSRSPSRWIRCCAPSSAASRRSAPRSGPSPASSRCAPGRAATARTSASNRLPGTSRPTPPTTNARSGSPVRARVARRTPASKRNRAASMPFGTTCTRAPGTPHPSSRVATVSDTATVAAPSRSPARYSARTPRVSGRPSISPSPRECSVATTARTPARRAANRPYRQARYRCVCTRSYRPPRMNRSSRGSALRSRFPRIPRCTTRTPSARSPSATGPGLVRVSTSQCIGMCRSSSRSCCSAPPTPSPVMTCSTRRSSRSFRPSRPSRPLIGAPPAAAPAPGAAAA